MMATIFVGYFFWDVLTKALVTMHSPALQTGS